MLRRGGGHVPMVAAMSSSRWAAATKLMRRLLLPTPESPMSSSGGSRIFRMGIRTLELDCLDTSIPIHHTDMSIP